MAWWSTSREISGSWSSAVSSEAKVSAPVALSVEERLLAHPVAGEQEAAAAASQRAKANMPCRCRTQSSPYSS